MTTIPLPPDRGLTVHRKAYAIQRADLVLVDEAHLIPRTASTSYRRFLGDLSRINPQLKIIGLTATPYRLDSGMLHTGPDALFDDIAFEVSVREVIDQGYLAPLISKQTTTQLDVSGVGTRGGEFIAGQLEAAVDQDPITRLRSTRSQRTAGTGVPGSCSAPGSITLVTCATRSGPAASPAPPSSAIRPRRTATASSPPSSAARSGRYP